MSPATEAATPIICARTDAQGLKHRLCGCTAWGPPHNTCSMRTLSLKEGSALTLSSQPSQRMLADDACKLQVLDRLSSPFELQSSLLPPPPRCLMLPLPPPFPGPPKPPSCGCRLTTPQMSEATGLLPSESQESLRCQEHACGGWLMAVHAGLWRSNERQSEASAVLAVQAAA